MFIFFIFFLYFLYFFYFIFCVDQAELVLDTLLSHISFVFYFYWSFVIFISFFYYLSLLFIFSVLLLTYISINNYLSICSLITLKVYLVNIAIFSIITPDLITFLPSFFIATITLSYTLVKSPQTIWCIGETTGEFRFRWNNYKFNDRKYIRNEDCFQQHLFSHFHSGEHTGFLKNVKIMLFDKNDGQNPNKRENY